MKPDNTSTRVATEPDADPEVRDLNEEPSGEPVIEELVEEISIDGMCGVY